MRKAERATDSLGCDSTLLRFNPRQLSCNAKNQAKSIGCRQELAFIVQCVYYLYP
jgi:hypothetical protein